MNKIMENYVERLIYWAAGHDNILPITSRCNVRCIFCSNHQNPAGVETFNLNPLTLEQVDEIINFLDPGRPVIIGEAVTRINEGEPFTHPRIKEITSLLRKSLPKTTIQLTTNGSLLDRDTIKYLKSLEPLTIYLSLNSINMRAQIMKDAHSQKAVATAAILQEHNIEWHGSIVAMPHYTGWPDFTDTIRYLDSCGAKTIRIFLPGYTRLTPERLRFPDNLTEQLRQTVSKLTETIKTPLTVEPPLIKDLDPVITGVISGSKAYDAGIKRGDVIYEVNGKKPFSRVDAFFMVKKSANPVLKINNGKQTVEKTIYKAAGQSTGLVMEYDINSTTVKSITEIAMKKAARKILLLASEMAAAVIELALKKHDCGINAKVVPVTNRFFGGNIKSAGLLVVDDFMETLNNYLLNHHKPELIILPQKAFDPSGRDLLGKHWSEIENKVSIPVEVL